ncbi:MAG: hypothetical protein GXP60_07275 [Epsilonproteobacteria bacterium]|nr:hypothetical protein [Campylobacterota bacterium]
MRSRRKVFFALLFIVPLLLSGCSTVKKYMGNSAVFKKQIEQKTKTAKLYNDFKTTAIGSAILLDRKFIDEYLKFYKQEKQPSYEMFQKKKNELYAYLNETTFLIKFYSPEDAFKSLGKGSKWQISFSLKNGKLYASKIKETGPLDWSYLFGINDWNKRYIVKFDTKESNGIITISSILGKLKFNFRDNSKK